MDSSQLSKIPITNNEKSASKGNREDSVTQRYDRLLENREGEEATKKGRNKRKSLSATKRNEY